MSKIGFVSLLNLPEFKSRRIHKSCDSLRFGQNLFIFCLLSRKFSKLSKLTIKGHELSPVKHLYLNDEQNFDIEREILYKIVDKVSASVPSIFSIIHYIQIPVH